MYLIKIQVTKITKLRDHSLNVLHCFKKRQKEVLKFMLLDLIWLFSANLRLIQKLTNLVTDQDMTLVIAIKIKKI